MSDILGGWTPFKTDITNEEHNLFKTVIKGLEGVDYRPLAIASQVVSGTNYCFFCNATVVYPGAPNDAALVYVYQPISGTPHIREIKRINA
jgi:hypothetical protein